MKYDKYLKSEYLNLGLEEIRISPITILNGVSKKAAESLNSLNVFTVYDLAYSTIFSNANKIANSSESINGFMKNEIIPSDVIDGGERIENIENIKFEDIQTLKGIGPENVISIKNELNIETIHDMANWPQYLAARKIIGLDSEETIIKDAEIPDELVPTFNEYAVDKSFYNIYTINSVEEKTDNPLEDALRIEDIMDPTKTPINEKIKTGQILRYEQSWTPVGMGLGNLLHSLALAPGESTRVAIVDWRRSQRVQTTESISQLESLTNTMVQNRSINEITNSIAHEAQSGFSNMNSNTSVTNTGRSNYGIQNMEETLAATGEGIMGGAILGGAAGGVAGMGIGTIVEPGGGTIVGGLIGAGSGAIIGGTGGGVGAFLTSADFGASQENKSLENVTATTVTSSEGVREVSANMAQNIMDRTHQYSSSSRNRRASIVQELSQSESENISTRVVTNYNHMHSLTIQYFEVVQMYRVATKLKNSQDCLFIPLKPINDWTKELINEFRQEIILSALTPNVYYLFMVGENILTLIIPTISNISNTDLPDYVKNDFDEMSDKLKRARLSTHSLVSSNIMNNWSLPNNYCLRKINIILPSKPMIIDGQQVQLTVGCKVHIHANRKKYSFPIGDTDFLNSKELLIKDIKLIEFEFQRGNDWNWEDYENMFSPFEFIFAANLEDDTDLDQNIEAFSFKSFFHLTKEDVEGNPKYLKFKLAHFSATPNYKELIEHLNQNTDYYSKQILKRKNPKLIRNIINGFDYRGELLSNFVDPDPVAISDNKLIFALKKPVGKKSDKNISETILKSDLIPVATEGVFAEAVQGRANSAEKLDISRFWNWQDSPIPIVAPEISPIQAGSRAMAADVRPGSLDASIVTNIQPNALPEPGTGTAAILNAISSEMFRDMSGIMQTAQLAQSSLEQAQEGATAAGGQSAESLKKGLDFTKDLVGKIIKMNSDYATLLASTGFGALTSGGGGVPSSGKSSNRGQTKGGGASSIPMTDPNTNVSNAGAALNAMKDADKNGKINFDRTKQTDSTDSIPGSGGDAPGSLYDEGLGTMMGSYYLPYGLSSIFSMIPGLIPDSRNSEADKPILKLIREKHTFKATENTSIGCKSTYITNNGNGHTTEVHGYRGILKIDDKEYDTIERANGFKHLHPGTYTLTMHPKIGSDKHALRVEGSYSNGRMYIHSANCPSQLTGCIAPGKKTEYGVTKSQDTIEEIINKLGGWSEGKEVTLIVENEA